MRWLLVLVTIAVGGVVALGLTARIAGSSTHGRDIWTVRLETSSTDHWILLDTGRVRAKGNPAFVFLLAHAKEDGPGNRYDAMKVVGALGGTSVWEYDGTGSDYVVASSLAPEGGSDESARLCSAPRLLDVDGDGSDDVVFLEHDFIFGTQLRAVRIEP